MTRQFFEQSLQTLRHQVVELSAQAESMLTQAMQALKLRDPLLARQVAEGDDAIDEGEMSIERECILLIAKQQPLAEDLRQVTAILKMITDIERIADQACDICELIEPDLSQLTLNFPRTIFDMGEFCVQMVHDAIHAYIHRDEDLAHNVVDRDDQVDTWYAECNQTLIGAMLLDSDCIPHALKMAHIAKYLERVADHATNIAEWAIYRITGIHVSN